MPWYICGMKIDFRLLFLICLFPLLILSSCQDHRDTSIDTFGELDSLQVAADTTMQVNMDRSYEYQKSLVENDTTVYDFLAYDKPKGSSSPDWESKFIIIKRTTHTHDTIVKEYRTGPVKGLALSDLDHDGKPEIQFYEVSRADKIKWLVRVFTSSGTRSYHEVSLRPVDVGSDLGHYRGGDTFFVSDDHYDLIRQYPYYKNTTDSFPDAVTSQSYKLSGNKLIFEKGNRSAK